MESLKMSDVKLYIEVALEVLIRFPRPRISFSYFRKATLLTL